MATKPKESKGALAPVKGKQTLAVNTELPSFLQNYQGPTGAETIDAADVTIPRIKICQNTSKEKDTVPQGALFLNVTKEILAGPGQTLRFIPLFSAKEYILWRDLKFQGGGIMARAKRVETTDGVRYAWDKPNQEFENKIDGKMGVVWKTKRFIEEDGLAEWGSEIPGNKESGIAAVAHHNYLVALPDHDNMICALSLARSGVKRAKDLNAMLKMSSVPMYARVFSAGTATETNGEGQEYFNFSFQPAGFLQDEASFNSFKELHEAWSKRDFTVDHSDEEAPAGDSETAAGEKKSGKGRKGF